VTLDVDSTSSASDGPVVERMTRWGRIKVMLSDIVELTGNIAMFWS
jgi:hypothetical protein